MTNPRKQLVERCAKAIYRNIPWGVVPKCLPMYHAKNAAKAVLRVIQPKRTKAGRDTERLDFLMQKPKHGLDYVAWVLLRQGRRAIDAAMKQGRGRK